MNTTQKRRLLKLARFLRTSPQVKEHFDLSMWYGTGNPNPWKPSQERATAKNFLNECNTTGCAIGWAAVCMPTVFKKDKDGIVHYPPLCTVPARGMFAAEFAFGIGMDEVSHLFSPGWYHITNWNNPIAVADRIEQLVKEYDASNN